MPLNANALTSLAKLKDYLEIAVLDTTQDTRLERLIDASSQMIETYCSRSFVSQSRVEYHDGRNANTLMLREYPASKPTKVCIDGGWTFVTSTELATSDYDVVDGSYLVLKSGFFPKGTRNVQVTYIAGYSTIPSDLEEACLMLAEWLYMHRNDRRSGITQKTKERETITYSKTIPLHITTMLTPYMRLDFPLSDSPVLNT
jgi:hypothetical protein